MRDYLECKELMKLGKSSTMPTERASIIANKLKNYMFVLETDNVKIPMQLFILDENTISYTKTLLVKDKICNATVNLISDSYKKAEKNEDFECNGARKITELCFVYKFYPLLVELLVISDDKLDNYKNELHYRNGYLNLVDGEFYPRVLHKNYITKYIERDYEKSTEKQRLKIMKDIIKILPNKEDRDYMMSRFGIAITGNICKEQQMMFCTGHGSNGKSLLMELLQESLSDVYLMTLPQDTFTLNNNNNDKIMNTYQSNPQIRLSWCNEPIQKKLDAASLKKFCDGKLCTRKLYAENAHSFSHNSMLITTANNLPDINIDGGVKRRLEAIDFSSEFVDNEEDVDENNHKYLKNKNLLTNIIKNKLLDAVVDILASYAVRHNKQEKFYPSKGAIESKNNVVVLNDHVQDFIDGYMDITNDKKHDKIGKAEMEKLYNEVYPNKHIKNALLVTLFRAKNIEYSLSKRVDNIQGCYVGVRWKCSPESKKTREEELIKRIKYLEEELQKYKLQN